MLAESTPEPRWRRGRSQNNAARIKSSEMQN